MNSTATAPSTTTGYTVVKVHSTKWAVQLNGKTVETAKTKGEANRIAEQLTADAAAKKATKSKLTVVKGGKAEGKVPAQKKQTAGSKTAIAAPFMKAHATGLSKAECLARLTELKYTGPTSYLLPALRGIVAWVEAGRPDNDAIPAAVREA
jgi:hypothetical protein